MHAISIIVFVLLLLLVIIYVNKCCENFEFEPNLIMNTGYRDPQSEWQI